MDVRKPLNFKEIEFLYDSLKSDIKELNDKIDFIAGEVQKTIKNLSEDDKGKLERGEYINSTKRYGRIINKAHLERREKREGGESKDRFADPHTEFLKEENQDLTAFKREIPQRLKELENLTEEQWNEKTDIEKIDIERSIRNKLYFVAEAMLPAINATKYEKKPGQTLGAGEYAYNAKVYTDKDNARVNFLVKLAEANELLEPEEKHFAGINEDNALCTFNMSVHFGSDKNLVDDFILANKILGRDEYPTELNKIQKEFAYDLPLFIHDKGLISHQVRDNIDKYIKEFMSKVLEITTDEKGKNHYELNEENLELYINFLHQDFTEREILHIANEINYRCKDQIFGKERILKIYQMLISREKLKGNNSVDKRISYVQELFENTDEKDRKNLIKKLQKVFLKGRIISYDYKTLDLSQLETFKKTLTRAGVRLDEIEECSKGLEEKLIKIVLANRKETEKILEKENIQLRQNPNKLFVTDKVIEILKEKYRFSEKIDRMELIELVSERTDRMRLTKLDLRELERSLKDRNGNFNEINFIRICSWGSKDCVKKAVEIANSENIKVDKYIKEDNAQR